MKKTALTLAICMALSSGIFAGEAGTCPLSQAAGSEAFKNLDKNSDGFLNAEEIAEVAELKEAFESLDKNQDALLDLAEYNSNSEK